MLIRGRNDLSTRRKIYHEVNLSTLDELPLLGSHVGFSIWTRLGIILRVTYQKSVA